MVKWPKLIGITSLIVASIFSGSTEAELIIQDDFDSGNTYSGGYFNSSEFDSNVDDISTASFSIQGTGGNPNGRMEITHMHDVNRDGSGDPLGGNGSTVVQSFFKLENISYNPQSQGQFDSITFSLDYNTSDPFAFAFFSVNNFNSGQFSGFDGLVTDGQWHTYQKTFSQSEFPLFDFSGSEDLKFGFGFYTALDVSFESYSAVLSADNFSVSLSAVPEPSSLLLVSLPAIVAMVGRRKRA